MRLSDNNKAEKQKHNFCYGKTNKLLVLKKSKKKKIKEKRMNELCYYFSCNFCCFLSSPPRIIELRVLRYYRVVLASPFIVHAKLLLISFSLIVRKLNRDATQTDNIIDHRLSIAQPSCARNTIFSSIHLRANQATFTRCIRN